MSALLNEILADLKALRIDYESCLKRIAELAKQVQAGKGPDTPENLNTPSKRALYNNLNKNEALALKIDETVRRVRPNAFRGNQAKETSSRLRFSHFWATTEPRWSGFSSLSKLSKNTDAHANSTR
jgi:hypothetical protein